MGNENSNVLSNSSPSGSQPDVHVLSKVTPRKAMVATLTILMVMAGFWILFRYRLVVFALFEAIVFSTAIRPIVNWLERHRISRAVGTTGVFILIVLLLVGIFTLLVPLFTDQSANILTTLLKYYQDFHQSLVNSPSILVQRLAMRLPTDLQVLPNSTPVNPAEPLDQVTIVIGYSRIFFHDIFLTLSVLLLTFYLTIDRDRILLSILFFVPVEKRNDARTFYEAVEEKVGAYLRGLGIMCLSIGAMSLVAYLIIGLPYAILLAILAGIMEAVPLIGPILGAIPAVMIALALDPTRVLWVVVATLIIQQSENHVLVPRVMDQSVGVNPVVSLLAFIIFGSLFGLAGGLLAIPLAATLQLIFNRAVIDSSDAVSSPPAGRDLISVLRYEAQELIIDVRRQVREKGTTLDDPSDQVEDAIETIVNDLDSILAKAEQTEPQNAEAQA